MMDTSRAIAAASVPAATTAGGAQFPAGLRVLVVDDDPTCLRILEKRLQNCLYEVTTCTRARQALEMLQQKTFDIVLSDVHMPDIDGFDLLAHIGLKMDLPVIMMSADDGTDMVLKGINYGACDYLIKPITKEALKNIWQHVVRRKKNLIVDSKEKDGEQSVSGEENERQRKPSDEHDNISSGNEVSTKNAKKRKDEKEEDDETEDREDTSTMKKPRVVWSVELHQQFVAAVNQLGVDKAVPKRILELMNVPGLTRENVASHLQKYRLYLKRAQNHNRNEMHLGATTESSYAAMGSLDGLDLQTLAVPGQLASQGFAAYQGGSRRLPNNRMALPIADQMNFLNYDAQITPSSKMGAMPGQDWNSRHMNFQSGTAAAVAPRKVGQSQQILQSYGTVGSHVIQGSSTLNDTLSATRGTGRGQHLLMQTTPRGQTFSLLQPQNHSLQQQTSGIVLNTIAECDPRFSSAIKQQAYQTNRSDSSFTTSYPASPQSSYSSFNSSARNSYPVVTNGGPSNLAPPNVCQEAKIIGFNGVNNLTSSCDLLSEFCLGKNQDWKLPNVNLPSDAVGNLGSKQIIDPISALTVGGTQKKSTVNKERISAINGFDQGKATSISQQNSTPLLENSTRLKVESVPELTYRDIPFSEPLFADELMTVIGEQQQDGTGLVDSEFNFDGYQLDNIPV